MAKITGTVRIGVIGAGRYASAMLLPHLARRKDVKLVEVATSTALSGANAARKFGFERTSTDYRELLRAEDIDAVIIATRHVSHAAMTAEALRAGKAVFVEKPLAIDRAGVELVRKALVETGNERLQVGFNRRFAPLVRQITEVFCPRLGPLVMHYRVHAGQVDKASWINNPEEGSRFTGEACHFFDLFNCLTQARPMNVYAQSIHPDRPTADDLENISAVVAYDDGSIGNLVYVTQGSAKAPKEFVEIFGVGKTAQLNNFESADIYEGSKHRTCGAGGMNKGQKEELDAFVQALKFGGEWPISIVSLLDTALVTIAATDSLRTGRPVQMSDYWISPS
jgi:predicted dehydrogenase